MQGCHGVDSQVFQMYSSMFVHILEYLHDCVELCQDLKVVYVYDHFELPRRFHNFSL